jgi:ribosomal-protein-alanine N-acetyltransferase
MNYSALPILETEHLILRPITLADAEDIFAYAQDPEVSRFLPWNAHQTLDDSLEIIHKWLKAYAENRPAPWGIVDKKSHKIIGTIVADQHHVESVDGSCLCLGYCLSKDFWGRGFMPEAVQKIIEYLFHQTTVKEVVAFVRTDNPQSQRVCEKSGMHKDPNGTKREYIKGASVDLERWLIRKKSGD